ncbi:PAR14 polymerase, partial [Amia calva]|nr:PAR14 polymerase [Amia calva]
MSQSPASSATTIVPKASALPSKVLKLDSYLLRFLQDCPQASPELQAQLSSLSCSMHLSPDEEQAVVTLEIEAPCAQWEERVEEAFARVQDQFHCHYEPDVTKQQTLRKHSFLASEELRVYSELSQGFTVIVGRRGDVAERLKVLEGIMSQAKLGHVKSDCRLPGAAYSLLGDSFEAELRIKFPGLLITRKDLNLLTLEGPSKEVQAARCSLKEGLGQIHERVVNLSRPLLSFLEDQGRVQEFHSRFLSNLKSPVVVDMELGLKIFSLSQQALEEASRVFLSELREEVRELGGPLASPATLSKLKESLCGVEMQLNQGKRRVQVQYVQDANTNKQSIQIVGYSQEVSRVTEALRYHELREAVTVAVVTLHNSEMVDCFHELMELLSVQAAGVKLTSVSSPSPAVQLTGPKHLVTSLQRSLEEALDGLVWEVLTINKPGAYEYFQNEGSKYLKMVGKSMHCLIRPSKPGQVRAVDPATITSQGVWCTFCLEGGLNLVVRQGDITQERVEAIVNASNEDLRHSSGVALRISKAGGPAIQKECTDWVQSKGQVLTGKAVKTTAGSLPFKMVIHAVGPQWRGGQGVDTVRSLLDSAVRESLELAERSGCLSLAMPCLSSGIFGVPLSLCAETIVGAVRNFARVPHMLQSVTLVDISRDTVAAFQAACAKVLGATGTGGYQGATGVTASSPGTRNSCICVEVALGNIEDQHVDVLVSAMKSRDLLSTRVGKALLEKAGNQLQQRFTQASQGTSISPGDVLQVDRITGLGCKLIFFIELIKWDGSQHGRAFEALRRGLSRVLEACESQGFSSIAFPVIGPGVVLGFPHNVAAQVLLEEIAHFEQSRQSAAVTFIRLVILPKDKEASLAFQDAQRRVNLKGLRMAMQSEQTSFYHSLTEVQDNVTLMLGGIQLKVVFGDILQERVDVIVNSTDFSTNHTGVCKAIMSAAGAAVQAEIAKVKSPPSGICATGPGHLPFKAIFHVCGKDSLDQIQKVSGKVLNLCEQKTFGSVVFPAIGTGAGGLNPRAVSKVMIDGFSSAVRDGSFHNLSTVRIVLLQRDVFQAFKSEAMSRLGKGAPPPTVRELSKNLLKLVQKRGNPPSSSPDRGPKRSFSTPNVPFNPAVLDVIGRKREDVRKAREELESIFEKLLCEREIVEEEVSMLADEDIDQILKRATSLKVTITPGRRLGIHIIRGLKEEVLDVVELVKSSQNKSLLKQVEERQQALMAMSVRWSFENPSGWHTFDLEANYLLEISYQKKDGPVNVSDGQGDMLRVDLDRKEATSWLTSQTYRVCRKENKQDFSFPNNWDSMANREILKKVVLQPNSAEYQQVATGFLQSAAQRTIKQIERVQNVFLRRAYWVKEQHLQQKNGLGSVGERMLYHGTAVETCNSIENCGFNRSFAGRNATAFGIGVYFAVNASYSARPTFSRPDPNGLQRMYVARVLTGCYTQGSSSMKVPPPRSPADPNNRYDSLVDNPQNPSMFVTFHDDQAYPEYLITFQ